MGTTKVWTADRGISARPRPKTVIGHAERVTRGLPRLPTMSDAKGSYMSQVKTDAMLVKRANYFQQRCPYDTIPKNIPGSNARGGQGAPRSSYHTQTQIITRSSRNPCHTPSASAASPRTYTKTLAP
jgi:hypothetical protein